MGIKISELAPTASPSRNASVPVANEGLSPRYTVAQILGLIASDDGAMADKQPLNATLTALAALVGDANKLPYFTGDNALALADLTAEARTFLAAVDKAAQRSALGVYDVVVDRGYDYSASQVDLTDVIPYDDTFPQNTEGTQLLSVAITPKSTTNKLRISGLLHFGTSTNDLWPIWAVFTSHSANAILAGTLALANVTQAFVSLPFGPIEVSPSTTSPLTISVRAGPRTAGTIRWNGNNTSGWLFGGAAISTLVVEEIRG